MFWQLAVVVDDKIMPEPLQSLGGSDGLMKEMAATWCRRSSVVIRLLTYKLVRLITNA